MENAKETLKQVTEKSQVLQQHAKDGNHPGVTSTSKEIGELAGTLGVGQHSYHSEIKDGNMVSETVKLGGDSTVHESNDA